MKRTSGWRTYWWIWAIASTVWVGFALAAFPQTRDWQQLWETLGVPDIALVAESDCATVLDVTAAQACAHTIRMRRQRVQGQRAEQMGAALQDVGIVIGPPLAVLVLTFLVTIVASDRFNRRPPPPAVHDAHYYMRTAPELRPTNYRPPHRREQARE